jgi:hypothetical protein
LFYILHESPIGHSLYSPPFVVENRAVRSSFLRCSGGHSLYSPPFVVENWAVRSSFLRCSGGYSLYSPPFVVENWAVRSSFPRCSGGQENGSSLCRAVIFCLLCYDQTNLSVRRLRRCCDVCFSVSCVMGVPEITHGLGGQQVTPKYPHQPPI